MRDRVHLLAKKAQARVDPWTVVPCVMTVLWLMVPPALRSVSPKTAKKIIGAITLLKPKKYWTCVVLVGVVGWVAIALEPYLGIRDAEEGKLEQKVEQEADHPRRGDALAGGDVVGDVGKAGPDGREQDGHALAARRGLDPGQLAS
jgi:hypothetical protein